MSLFILDVVMIWAAMILGFLAGVWWAGRSEP